jgi:hypothetical protein
MMPRRECGGQISGAEPVRTTKWRGQAAPVLYRLSPGIENVPNMCGHVGGGSQWRLSAYSYRQESAAERRCQSIDGSGKITRVGACVRGERSVLFGGHFVIR